MRKNILKFVPVRYLLLAAFAVLFIGLIYTQIAQYKQYQRLTSRYSTITGSSVEKLSLLINLRRGSDYVQTNVLHLLLTSDPAELAATRKKIQQEVERNDTNMREFQQLMMANGKEEKELFDSLVFYRQQNNAVRKLLLNNSCCGSNKPS
jgi:hypothetical protein